MLEHELFKLLINLGEKLTKEEAKGLMTDLCDPADAEGFMPFLRKFLFISSYNFVLFYNDDIIIKITFSIFGKNV